MSQLGVQVGIVVGGGNFWRGLKDGGDRMVRVRADHMGMLATAINALARGRRAGAEGRGGPGADRHRDALGGRAYIRSKAIRHLEKGESGHLRLRHRQPFFSTDTAAVLRAAEIDADVILLAKNIDGVYSADPRKVPDAVKYESITYSDVLASGSRSWTPPPPPCPWTTRFPCCCLP